MNFFVLVTAGVMLFLAACKPQAEPETAARPATPSGDSLSTNVPYFPLASFLKNEVDHVDSLPVGIKKYITRNGKTDSSYISLDEFHQLAADFFSPELNDSVFKSKFAESSFLDRSTNSATFFYKAADPMQAVQRVDVVTMKGDVYDEVRSIYIEKKIKKGTEVIAKKMFWRPKRHFQIIALPGDESRSTEANIVKVVWDNRD